MSDMRPKKTSTEPLLPGPEAPRPKRPSEVILASAELRLDEAMRGGAPPSVALETLAVLVEVLYEIRDAAGDL